MLGAGFVSLPERKASGNLFAKLPQNSAAGEYLADLQEKEVWTLTDWTTATEQQFAAALDTLLNAPAPDA